MSFSRIKKNDEFGANISMNKVSSLAANGKSGKKISAVTKPVNKVKEEQAKKQVQLEDNSNPNDINRSVVLQPPFLSLGEYSPMKKKLYRWAVSKIAQDYVESYMEIEFPVSEMTRKVSQLYEDNSHFADAYIAVVNYVNATNKDIVDDILNEDNIPYLVTREDGNLIVWYNNEVQSQMTKEEMGMNWVIKFPYVSINPDSQLALLIVFGFEPANSEQAIELITKKAQLY